MKALLAAIVLAFAVVVPAQPAQTASYWGGSFNMDHGNDAYEQETAAARSNAVIASINSRRPAFLAVQETCYATAAR